MKETQIEEQILSFLQARGGLVLKIPSTGYFDAKKKVFRKQVSKFVRRGISDIFYIENGKTYFFEVKSVKKHEYIKRHLDSIMASGGIGLNKDRKHIFEQGLFLFDVIGCDGHGGFVSSVDDVLGIINKALSRRG